MNPIIRNILAVIAGIIAGGTANMLIIMISGSVIPLPEGVDTSTTEGFKAALPLLSAKHFIMPFLAHALGSFVGALVAALLAVSHKMKFALGLGALTMVGGIVAAFILPAPAWFIALDLIAAYIPTAYIAGIIAGARK